MTNIEKVCSVIEQETGKSVTESSTLESLGIDSLETLDLLLKIEEKAGVTFPLDRISEINVIGDIVRIGESR